MKSVCILLISTLLANEMQTLGSSCILCQWCVAFFWFDDFWSIQPACYQFCSVAMDSRSKWLDTVTWLLIGGLSQELNLNCGFPVSAPPALLHLWQASQPLPSLEPVLVVIDLSNLYTQQSPSPCWWHISQNYALVFMSYPWGCVVAHCTMLCNLCNQNASPSKSFLTAS